MPLIKLWESSPAAISEFTIEQVVAAAGDGALRDNTTCSTELREYLTKIPASKIAAYVDHCLTSSFPKSGSVLQDLMNELARRLDYTVRNGRYQGTSSAIGFDGIWVSPEGHSIIAEVKTTDAYRISLDTIAEYRRRLIDAQEINDESSILIITGREDTGELEAQVRGSRHAWDMRLISADALIKLVSLKENAEGPDTGHKIRRLLVPMEYTRLDDLVDAMLTTAIDVEAAVVEAVAEGTSDVANKPTRISGVWQFTDSADLDAKRQDILGAFEAILRKSLIKRSRALYSDANGEVRVACSISKRYEKRGVHRYWYAYHPRWDEFLREGRSSFIVLGCMDLPFDFAIPRDTLVKVLQNLNTTVTDKGPYWHMQVIEPNPESYALLLPKTEADLPLESFKIPINR
jgi:hypothetical protein